MRFHTSLNTDDIWDLNYGLQNKGKGTSVQFNPFILLCSPFFSTSWVVSSSMFCQAHQHHETDSSCCCQSYTTSRVWWVRVWSWPHPRQQAEEVNGDLIVAGYNHTMLLLKATKHAYDSVFFSIFLCSLGMGVLCLLFFFLLSPPMLPNLKYGKISVMLHYAVWSISLLMHTVPQYPCDMYCFGWGGLLWSVWTFQS